jgi:predicted dehydrogenase
MANRRDFVKGAAAAAFFSRTVLGANDRINYAFIGLGGRTGLLDAAWMKQPDGNLVAVCDCNKAKIDAYQKLKLADKKVDTFGDYRRVLDRKDIDAVLVAVPDHNHAPIMIAALEAGKDVYMEKPCSNTVEAAVAMLKAYRAHKQVVQLGTQQRSWDHFQEVARLVRDGALGPVNQILVGLSGGGGGGFGRARGPQAAPSAPPPIPEGLDWNAFLGPAKQVLYDPARLGWRGWYDYGGGLITDWGVHWLDIVHLAMGADTSGPSSAAAVSAYPGEENPNLRLYPGESERLYHPQQSQQRSHARREPGWRARYSGYGSAGWSARRNARRACRSCDSRPRRSIATASHRGEVVRAHIRRQRGA